MNFIKKTSQFFLRIDPTYDALIKTLKMSLPCYAGVILWLNFDHFFSFFFIIVSFLILSLTECSRTLKDKFIAMIVVTLLVILYSILLSIIYINITLLLIFFFIATFYTFSVIKYKISFLFGWIFLTISLLMLPKGLDSGIHRAITTVIGLGLSILFFVLFEFFSSKLRLKASIVHLASNFNKLLIYSFTLDSSLILKSKKKAKTYSEHVLDVEIDIIEYKLHSISYFVEAKLFPDGYLFPAHRKCAEKYLDTLVVYKKLIRDLSLIFQYKKYKYLLLENAPLSTELIDSIILQFNHILISINKKSSLELLDYTDLFHTWNKQVDNSSDNISKDSIIEYSEIIHGIKCLITDQKELIKTLE